MTELNCVETVADMEDPEAIVSPGGVGFDINCGVRLLRTNLTEVKNVSQVGCFRVREISLFQFCCLPLNSEMCNL